MNYSAGIFTLLGVNKKMDHPDSSKIRRIMMKSMVGLAITFDDLQGLMPTQSFAVKRNYFPLAIRLPQELR